MVEACSVEPLRGRITKEGTVVPGPGAAVARSVADWRLTHN
jgi:hypothetical protein